MHASPSFFRGAFENGAAGVLGEPAIAVQRASSIRTDALAYLFQPDAHTVIRPLVIGGPTERIKPGLNRLLLMKP